MRRELLHSFMHSLMHTSLLPSIFPQLSLHISRSVYKEFNSYLVAMVAHLWNSRSFSPRSGIEVSEELLHQTKVADHSKSFDLIHHPAFLNYALDFHRQVRKHTTTCVNYIAMNIWWIQQHKYFCVYSI